MGKKGPVISKQKLSDKFFGGFHASELTLKVEETGVCSETDADAFWQVLLCLMEHDAEEDGELSGGQVHPCLMLLEMGKLPDSDPL